MAARTFRLTLLIATVALVFAVTACSDNDDTPDADDLGTSVGKAGGAETELCSDLNQLESAVDEVKGLTATSTIDDAKDAAGNVKDAVSDLKKSADDAISTKVDAAETAFAGLQGVLDDMGGQETLGAAIVLFIQEVSKLANAVLALETDAGCS